eukprot:1624100-Pyramimonas_sp.AAC.1
MTLCGAAPTASVGAARMPASSHMSFNRLTFLQTNCCTSRRDMPEATALGAPVHATKKSCLVPDTRRAQGRGPPLDA